MSPGEIVMNGQLAAALPLAVLAGLLSFASPCVLPLVPGYLAYIGGAAGATGAEGGRSSRRRLLIGVAGFVLGFSLVFVLTGAFLGTIGVFLTQWQGVLTRVFGVLILVLGFVFIGQIGPLQRTVKPTLRPVTGYLGAPLLGIVFAIGWTPCIGPVMVAIQAMSVGAGSPARGALLAFVYCLGLGIPFVLLALGFGWATDSVAFLKRHIRVINIVGGVLLMLIGLLMVSGVWEILMSRLGAVIGSFEPAL
ncbi:cytochrome c biogenesis CcdA family protein [Mycetocola reblochoni]|uniref:Cytochrome c-type biogenesis protein CcdA (DsbD analog) n=2 Tax=Mycetocola reblochoni TaxID=331618 RepID=A0A1R4IWZ8_9MICO|nr:cytochrome c biogenesis protein CcdA [Mycetocola reblochoni]RLP70932.1 cytochrome c biogenesis protein CcdA [Mycetocola reblochoni]SJN24407.1 Cytochrome c-type biogenesis protein CcdA (DsbD analog) [Mycetocola reblochoni REB411]